MADRWHGISPIRQYCYSFCSFEVFADLFLGAENSVLYMFGIG
tara:strand:+ start:2938 stop:3066 length:129 start_codon:yes stop_codon:yes gene_type:complete